MADDDGPDPQLAAAVESLLSLINKTGPERSQEAAREIATRLGITSDMVAAALTRTGLSGSAGSRAGDWLRSDAPAQARGVVTAGGVTAGGVTAPAARELHVSATVTVHATITGHATVTRHGAAHVADESVDSLLDRARRHGTELLDRDEVYTPVLFLLLVLLLNVLAPREQQWIVEKATLVGVAWHLAGHVVNRPRKK